MWNSSADKTKENNIGPARSIHEKCGQAIDKILHKCVWDKTLDNITAVIIGFENFEKALGTQST